MSRIAATFAALAGRGRKALIPYVTAGDPHADTTPQIMRAMVEAGADVIELGVPFSDPMADGPVIQKASDCTSSVRKREASAPSATRSNTSTDPCSARLSRSPCPSRCPPS